MDLRGTWEWSPDGASDWRPLQLPAGMFSRAGITEADFFVRRSVSLPSVPEPTESWALVFGDLRGAVARAWINGHQLGDVGAFETTDKGNFGGLELVRVPAWALHAGDNVVQLEFRTQSLSYAALADERLLFGPARVLVPWFIRTQGLETFLKTAPLLTFACFAVLLVMLAMIAASDRDRRLALRALAVIIGAGLYLWMHSGLGLTGLVPFFLRVNLVVTGVVLVVWSYFGFLMEYFEQPLKRLRVVNQIVSVAVIVSGPFLPVLAAYRVYAVWTVAMHVAMTTLVFRALKKGSNALVMMLTSTMLVFVLVGIGDLGSDLGFFHLPRMFALSLTNAAVVAGVVVIASFISISNRNRQLTASLGRSNEELASALTEARQATRLKSEFLASVSHELRTPLNSIINIPEGLLEDFPSGADGSVTFDGDPGTVARYLKTLHTSGVHLLGVVDQVLDFSKLEAGRMTLHPEPVKAAALLEDVLRTLEPLAQKRGITLKSTGAEQHTFVADAVKVAQVLLNLGNNAVKFSPDQGVVTFAVQASATSVEFRVSDRGIGIAPENLATIFEGFRQVEGGSTRRFGGTGLGLSISRRLAALHGGSLRVESVLGQGSTFIATFPLTPGKPTELKPVRLDEHRPCVLVIDDETLVQETLRLSLRHLELDVVPVEDPRRALAVAHDLRPNLIILDVMMPRVSGLTLLRELRESEVLAQTPVVVLSAYPSNREVVVGMGARWLSKPWIPEELVSTVRELAGLDETGAAPSA